MTSQQLRPLASARIWPAANLIYRTLTEPWVGALWGCLLFGFLDAISIRLQGAQLPLTGEVSVQAIQGLPYLLTVVLFAGFFGSGVAPQALGRPYVKGR